MSQEFAKHFLLNVLFDAYMFVVIIRLLAQQQQVSLANPVMSFMAKVTHFYAALADRALPIVFGLSTGQLLFLYLLQIVQTYLLYVFNLGVTWPHLLGILLLAFAWMLSKFINIYFALLIFSVVISWVEAFQNNPFADIVMAVTRPLRRLGQLVIPPIGGLDLSPIVVLLALQLFALYVLFPITNLATDIIL